MKPQSFLIHAIHPYRELAGLFLLLQMCVLPLHGEGRATPTSKSISTDLVGIFLEDINYSCDGGLYAEMVQNRSFEYTPSDVDLGLYYKKGQWHPFTSWEVVKREGEKQRIGTNSICRVTLESERPLNPNNRHYARLQVYTAGKNGAGLRNNGYEGMVVTAGDKYDFSAYLRYEGEVPSNMSTPTIDAPQNGMTALVRIVDGDSVLADTTFVVTSREWRKFTAILSPMKSCENAALEVRFLNTGIVDMDMISLFPEKTFNGHGLCADMVQVLYDLQPKFVRFPGGCFSHGDGLNNIYRWKQSIGPVEERTEDYNIWNYHQTKGMGFYEFFQLCEDIHAKPLPVLAAGVSCQNSARARGNGQQAIPLGKEMDEYVQDMLDLIEWANGDISTTWGKKRAEAGHPAPFNLEYIGIGNEDHITPEFKERFKLINDAIKAQYPNIKVVGTVGPNPDDWDYHEGWKYANEEHLDLVDEHYYRAPEWFLNNLHRYDNYARNNADGSSATKVYIGEYASRGNTLWNAICEAAYLTSVERNGDVISLASYAPLFARVGNTQWNPDLIYFDKTDVYPTINYYVQQLFAQNQGDKYVDLTFMKGEKNDTLKTASCVTCSKSGAVILKLVNTTDSALITKANLSKLKLKSKKATVSILTGPRHAKNGQDKHESTDIKPTITNEKVSKHFTRILPPYSLTVIRIESFVNE